MSYVICVVLIVSTDKDLTLVSFPDAMVINDHPSVSHSLLEPLHIQFSTWACLFVLKIPFLSISVWPFLLCLIGMHEYLPQLITVCSLLVLYSLQLHLIGEIMKSHWIRGSPTITQSLFEV